MHWAVILACATLASGLHRSQFPCDINGQEYLSCPAPWKHVGPGGYTDMGDSTNMVSAGAIQDLVEGAPGVWYVGLVNGGVWRCRDIYAARPHWESLLDDQPVTCSSMSKLAVSPHNHSHMFAGCGGSTSSEMGGNWNVLNTGDWGGLMMSLDGGDSWGMTNFPENFYITGIVSVAPTTLLVSARSNFFNKDDGGIWVSHNHGKTWNRTFNKPVFSLIQEPKSGLFLAAVALVADNMYYSADGIGWESWSEGLAWTGGRLPFYNILTIQMAHDPPVVFLGALTVNRLNTTDTWSDIWSRELPSREGVAAGQWVRVPGQPDRLDNDGMPKDRMALLADPTDPTILYVAGNAESAVYRSVWTEGKWWEMWGKDTVDASEPHVDCRNYAWDNQRGNLLLVSDGSIFRREQPGKPGGKWLGIAGDMGGAEFYTAVWDNRLSRFAAGAQDNSVQIAPPNTTATTQALGVVGGDGTIVQVDNVHCPARLYGAVQNIAGLNYVEGHPLHQVAIPVAETWFPDLRTFPFFSSAFALNSQDPTRLVFWANGTQGRHNALWEVVIPPTAKSTGDIKPPKEILKTEGSVYTLVVGGWTQDIADPNVVVGMNNTHLLHRNSLTNGELIARRLPATFAQPLDFLYFWDNDTAQAIGPLSHWKTVSLAVSPADSHLVAVTGWPNTLTNAGGEEGVWVSLDAGRMWKDVTGNLLRATGAVGRGRPAGLLLMEFPSVNSTALLAGTVTGVYVTWLDARHEGLWYRLGQCADFPLVLTPGITYEHYSDTLVIATMGRGVYTVPNAKRVLLRSRAQQDQGRCAAVSTVTPDSSAQYFPAQKAC